MGVILTTFFCCDSTNHTLLSGPFVAAPISGPKKPVNPFPVGSPKKVAVPAFVNLTIESRLSGEPELSTSDTLIQPLPSEPSVIRCGITWLVGLAGSMSGNLWIDPSGPMYPACVLTGSVNQMLPSEPAASANGLTVRGISGSGIFVIVRPGI